VKVNESANAPLLTISRVVIASPNLEAMDKFNLDLSVTDLLVFVLGPALIWQLFIKFCSANEMPSPDVSQRAEGTEESFIRSRLMGTIST
jgi:hypothetical protein